MQIDILVMTYNDLRRGEHEQYNTTGQVSPMERKTPQQYHLDIGTQLCTFEYRRFFADSYSAGD